MEASRDTAGGGGDGARLPESRDETRYVILQKGDEGGYWPVETPGTEDGHVPAGSAKQAVTKHLEAVDVDDDNDPAGRVYVAVPARSWKPITVGGVKVVPAKRQFDLS